MEFLFLVAFLALVIYSFRKWPKSDDRVEEDCGCQDEPPQMIG